MRVLLFSPHIGHTGKMYFAESDCETPEVASFSTGGWDEMVDNPGGAFSEAVAANFGMCILFLLVFISRIAKVSHLLFRSCLN